MSLNVLTQGGGAGGKSASIFITGLSEADVVTATKDGKTLHGRWTGNRHEISPIKSYGMWTISATNGEQAKTQDVFVDAALDYEIAMSYTPNYLMLYDFGDECEEITGGWTGQITSPVSYYSGAKSKLTKNSNNFTNPTMAFRQYHSLVTANKISSTGYDFIGTMCDFQTPDNTAVVVMLSNSATTDDESSTRNGRVYMYHKSGKIFGFDSIGDNNLLCYGAIVVQGGGSPSTGNIYVHAAFLLKEDKWANVAEIANISAATVDELLAASDILFTNGRAVQLMVSQCTGSFMVSAISSSTFMAALKNSRYRELVTTDAHWGKFMKMLS